MAQQNDRPAGSKANTAPGQQKTYDITGTAPDGTALPARTVTQQQWREEKLGKQGYVKPEDLDDTETDETSGT